MPSQADPQMTISAALSSRPFNFKTQVISASPNKSNIGQRRGHRYKHSSISAHHQIFQEPPLRPPPVLPASLPVPTVAETWKSMHRDQRRRLYWSSCHLVVAICIYLRSHDSLAATALSHLVFFDAGSAAVCATVDVLGNFEVWRRSSMRHPFGLERAEVLHLFESLGDVSVGHDHAPGGVSTGSIDMVAAIAIASTLVSAYGLRNHARIAKIMRVSYLAALPSVLSNPFHFLTLFISALVAVLPLLSISLFVWLDRLICAIISMAMFGLGARAATAQGLMLLMSYGECNGKSSIASVLREITSDVAIRRIEDAQFWQVNYGLCVANVKISLVKGYDETSLCMLRNRISSLIQNRLGEGYGTGVSVRWEVTVQVIADLGI